VLLQAKKTYAELCHHDELTMTPDARNGNAAMEGTNDAYNDIVLVDGLT
jgi:hypothetical protein